MRIRCSQRTMQLATVSYSVQVVYDGRKYTVHLPDLTVPQCSNCQAISIDEAAGDQIDLAFRREAGLLTSDQIRENRERLDLTQEELAARLGIAMATLSRWETGSQVQQRAFDRFLRISSRRKMCERPWRTSGTCPVLVSPDDGASAHRSQQTFVLLSFPAAVW